MHHSPTAYAHLSLSVRFDFWLGDSVFCPSRRPAKVKVVEDLQDAGSVDDEQEHEPDLVLASSRPPQCQSLPKYRPDQQNDNQPSVVAQPGADGLIENRVVGVHRAIVRRLWRHVKRLIDANFLIKLGVMHNIL